MEEFLSRLNKIFFPLYVSSKMVSLLEGDAVAFANLSIAMERACDPCTTKCSPNKMILPGAEASISTVITLYYLK